VSRELLVAAHTAVTFGGGLVGERVRVVERPGGLAWRCRCGLSGAFYGSLRGDGPVIPLARFLAAHLAERFPCSIAGPRNGAASPRAR
jgi:hypothetical protein